tara:strand:- start:1499 stop:2302 length:804 start_codon:yes stop_codon:yes gene_type:complete
MYSQSKILTTWDKVWEDKNNLIEWDYLSQVVLDVLLEEIPENNQTFIEVGSGSGRISHKLGQLGAKVTLLDISSQAIQEGKRLFQKTHTSCKLIRGSLFQIPCQESSYDVVWNSGVVEHYLNDELNLALKEMARISREKGMVIVIVPYEGSFLHSIGKAVIEKLVEYPYGDEYPIKTLQPELESISCKFVKKEYSVGFFVLFVGALKRLMLLKGGIIFKPIYLMLNRFFLYMTLHSPFATKLKKMDLMFSKLFGGYLLVSILKKNKI